MGMYSRRNFIAASGALMTGAAFPVIAQTESTSMRATRGIEGLQAPELSFHYWIDAKGKPGSFSMKESRGKWVFMKFFQNWCPGCHEYGFPALKAFSDEFHDHPDVKIAAVQTVFEGYNSNTVDDVRKLQLRYELPIMMGHDEGDAINHKLPSTMRNYRTGGTPWMVLVAPDGMVVFNDFHVNSDSLIQFVKANVA